jgi:hypothetical protein
MDYLTWQLISFGDAVHMALSHFSLAIRIFQASITNRKKAQNLMMTARGVLFFQLTSTIRYRACFDYHRRPSFFQHCESTFCQVTLITTASPTAVCALNECKCTLYHWNKKHANKKTRVLNNYRSCIRHCKWHGALLLKVYLVCAQSACALEIMQSETTYFFTLFRSSHRWK